MSKTLSKECIGCGRQFIVLNIDDTNFNFCTEQCRESHSILEENRKNREG